MGYILLGQLVAYAACWGITVQIAPAYQLVMLGVVALFGELIACPLLDGNATIKAALQSSRLSRWYPFTVGLLGAATWIIATVVTWRGLERWLPFDTFALSLFLTCIWIAAGVLAPVAITERIASSRLQRVS
jgi:hypothetical protein